MPQPKALIRKPVSSVFPFTFNVKCLILVLVAFVFYSNTLQNGYLLDDNLAIVSNDYVQEGFSGIGKILTNDSYISWMKKTGMDKHKLSTGRYRPLSIVLFAIEHSLFGESTLMRHFIEILCFCAILIAMLWFLDKFLLRTVKGGSDIAFLATLLFAIHPVHTEVVANVKSTDEILSLLFIILTFIFSLTYIKNKNLLYLFSGLLTYLLALLSKEYAIILLVLLPILFYLVGNKPPLKAFILSLPYYSSFIIYMALRIHAVGPPVHVVNNDVAINPFVYASTTQAIATKIFVLGKYLVLLFFPYPLSYDYNYNQVPYHNFSDLSVWLSVVIYVGIIAWGLWLLYKKNMITFPVLFFLANVALISNFLMDISSLMGERLIFHASFGFVTVLSYGIITASKRVVFKISQPVIFSIIGLVMILCAAEVWKRNRVWNDFETLATTDVNVAPNSIMANDYAAMSFIFWADEKKDSLNTKTYLRKAIECEFRATGLMKNYFNGYYRLGISYNQLKISDSALYFLTIAKSINPYDPDLKKYLGNFYLSEGCNMGKKGDFNGAISQMWKGINESPDDAEIWYNLGGAYFTAHKYDSAKYAWTKTLELDPKNASAANGLKAVSGN